MSRDLNREYRNIKASERNQNQTIKTIISQLNDAYADLVAIAIEKEEILIRMTEIKETK